MIYESLLNTTVAVKLIKKKKIKLKLKCCGAKLYKGEKCTCGMVTNLIISNSSECYTQSQAHGFTWEGDIRVKVFLLSSNKNDTNKYDVVTDNENCSIKTTGSDNICLSDIQRFYNYNFSKKNTIFVIKYNQVDDYKIIKNIYEIDYNKKCHEMLFGNLPLSEIEEYNKMVKTIPVKVKGEEATSIFDYLNKKRELVYKYDFQIGINPKVDSSQSRVQCSVNLNVLSEFITYTSNDETPNLIRGKKIEKQIYSPPRERGGITVKKLKDICRDNGVKGFSKLKKDELISILSSKNLMPVAS
jgi:hypothetical protein